ncbi:thiosulfate oxidation carrier protein SoxY [Methylobacterium sp. C25]|uniref:thiosulfate oxidation carrier protein SoxY n=1 Tax=Methylobacterium sp. C25 TaxID=2721622 RepID=UPI001F3DA8FE|nr:thiosulfate oxidation carrier protein SoxY [Methylobacterium sp. C25]MCE4226484.1 thiosulfate oxidation carrier protein SoxY [Methylobacterium sp. C25]
MAACDSKKFDRRFVLQAAGLGSVLAAASFAYPIRASANTDAAYPADAFKQKGEAEAVKKLFGQAAVASDKVKLDAPEIAENGAVVPISVSTDLPDVTSIAILVAENPSALAALYKFAPGTPPSVASRLKMAKTTPVIAVVEAGGKLYSATKEVKVTVGGCGG